MTDASAIDVSTRTPPAGVLECERRTTHRVARPWRRVLAPAFGALLVLSGCQPSAPTGAPVSPTIAPSATRSPAGSPAGFGSADALRNAVDVDHIVTDLASLGAIAGAHDGNRAVGTAGYDASASYVADELRKAGLAVELRPVAVHAFRQDAPSTLEIQAPGAAAFADIRDFKAMLFSAAGDVTAPVFALGYDRAAQPGDRNGLGCAAADWAGVPTGAIVLLQPAGCRRHDAVVQAQAAGALAVITAYAEWPRDGVLRPTLLEPNDIRIPVIGTTKAVGDALADAAAAGRRAHVAVRTSTDERTSMNVLAETTSGDPTRVVMLGGHLDSVIDGPGINDNGSGAMTVLEIARELAAMVAGAGAQPAWKVRLAFWAGEEIGLAGSAAYMRGLSGTAASAIQAYLNFDMLGSPNGVRFVYDPAVSSRQREGAVVAGLFEQAFAADGLVSLRNDEVGGASDHAPFDQSGITVGGLFSGANERKTADQASLFGGVAGAADDACYHLACDSIDNVDRTLLGQMARDAAWATGALASGEVDLAAP